MSWTFCGSGSAVFKAGLNVNSGITASGSPMTNWSNEAEGTICQLTRRDWLTHYSDLSTPIKYALEDICSSMIAKQMISFDMSGYTNTQEAFTMLNIQDDVIRTGIKILEDFKSNTLKEP